MDTQTIGKHLTRVGIKEDSIHLPVSKLSGGMRRRVAIVRAILAESEILFWMNPQSLDSDTKQLVIQYIKANTQGKPLYGYS